MRTIELVQRLTAAGIKVTEYNVQSKLEVACVTLDRGRDIQILGSMMVLFRPRHSGKTEAICETVAELIEAIQHGTGAGVQRRKEADRAG